MPISVHTEITDEGRVASRARSSGDAEAPARGWIFYDGECQFCRNWVRRMQPILGPRGFALVPLQTPWVRDSPQLPQAELLSEMRLLLPIGKSLGGADAIIEVAKYVWWTWPLVALAHVPGLREALRAGYRRVAARRYCLGGTSVAPGQVATSPCKHQSRSK